MLASLKDDMYVQQNIPKTDPNIQLLVKLLNTYGRTVHMMKNPSGKTIFHVSPSYDGKDTIELEYNIYSNKEDSAKQLDNAIKKIMSVPEFEAIQDKSMNAKAQLLDKFRHKYAPLKDGKLIFLRKFYRGKLRKLPEDFLEFYQGLMGLVKSNFVSPEQLKKIIKMYERKAPSEKITLPNVGKYGVFNIDDIRVLEPEEPLFLDANFAAMIKDSVFTIELIDKLKEEYKKPKEEPLRELTNLEEDLTSGDKSKTPELGLSNLEEGLNNPE